MIKNICFLVDTELELPKESKGFLEDLKSFLKFFHEVALPEIVSCGYGNIKYRFFFYGNCADEMKVFSSETFCGRFKEFENIEISCENLYVESLGTAYKKVVEYYSEHEKDILEPLSAIFIIVFRHTNEGGTFESCFNKMQGNRLKRANRIVIGVNKNEHFADAKSLCRLGYLAHDNLNSYFNYSTENRADNSQVLEIIKHFSVPNDCHITSWVKKDPALSAQASNAVSLSKTANCKGINDVEHETSAEKAYDNTAAEEDIHSDKKADFKSENVEFSENHTNVDLSKCTYNERLDCAIQALDCISFGGSEKDLAKNLNDRQRFFKNLPFMRTFDFNAIPDFICVNVNYFVSYLVFYIMSGGEYPQNIWKELFNDYNNSPMGKLEGVKNEAKELTTELCGKKVASEIEGVFEKIYCDRKRICIQSVVKDLEGLGCAKIFELLFWIFTKWPKSCSTYWWRGILSDFRSKKFILREVPLSEKCGHAELFAVSYKGQLEKPGKIECEDYSFIKKYNNGAWLAVVADGVGSCEYSSLGSEKAASCLSDCIAEYLYSVFQSAAELVDRKFIAELMYYFKFNLVNDFYNKWEKTIKLSSNYEVSEGVDNMSKFSTTLQFAFGYAELIVCGALGDGSFYVKRKCEATGSRGGFVLNDGFSGKLSDQVLNVPNLKNEPKTLHITFFDSSDISDILISSDGITGAVGKSVRDLDAFCAKMSVLPFDKRKDVLDKLARKCSDVNTTNYGGGDDSSIAYIHIN